MSSSLGEPAKVRGLTKKQGIVIVRGDDMGFTTTLTTKNQLTLPKPVRDKLGVKKGVKFDIYPTPDGFIGRLKRRSRILDFAGDLNDLDNGKSLKEIREESQKRAATEINKKISPAK